MDPGLWAQGPCGPGAHGPGAHGPRIFRAMVFFGFLTILVPSWRDLARFGWGWGYILKFFFDLGTILEASLEVILMILGLYVDAFS